ncbi:MAG: hypothetical protein F6J93_04650 [Oscillatoria sp. SIO1A7]|nr:hypothetical protein [Oscillatoria sp. SIO1A7]
MDRFQDYGFQDSRELVVAALQSLQSALELANKERSAALYASKHAEQSNELEGPTRRPPLVGSMKGTFVLPLPEYFDEPTDDFEEYM